ncbi:hypothetical protein ACSV5M_18830 [Cellvibrio sp. ARAG 10.3]|uniref:hypothetical protein n=1 Tax=Cellvibrio sp. ARAG 10.3 TaxID=3451358 RepID=UPI003F4648C5
MNVFAGTPTVITFGSGEIVPKEEIYEYHLLRLALDATKAEYGEYEIKDLPRGDVPTYSRLRVYAEDNQFENFVYKDSASNEIIEKLRGVEFPVDLGVTGYRIGFVSPDSKRKIAAIESLEELLRLKIIQGRGWLDGEILRKIGFKVVEGGNVKGLFYMAANDRGDIFLIGANELEREWRKNQDVEYLNYDENICIYYPLPKFFFVNKDNKKLAERIEKGLLIAYQSGSVRKLWDEYYGEAVRFAKLSKRKIFRFDNPLIDSLGKDYERFIINPELL